MGQADFYQEGDWNARCARCGAKRKASEMRKLPPGVEGAGMYVCAEHWEPRHPQEYVRGVPDNMGVPWSQDIPDFMLEICSLTGVTCYADLAVADCAICDWVPSGFDFSDLDLSLGLALDEDDEMLILTDDTLQEIIP